MFFKKVCLTTTFKNPMILEKSILEYSFCFFLRISKLKKQSLEILKKICLKNNKFLEFKSAIIEGMPQNKYNKFYTFYELGSNSFIDQSV